MIAPRPPPHLPLWVLSRSESSTCRAEVSFLEAGTADKRTDVEAFICQPRLKCRLIGVARHRPFPPIHARPTTAVDEWWTAPRCIFMILINYDNTVGAGFIACVLSAVYVSLPVATNGHDNLKWGDWTRLFGITITQGVHYIQSFKSDGRFTMAIVRDIQIGPLNHRSDHRIIGSNFDVWIAFLSVTFPKRLTLRWCQRLADVFHTVLTTQATFVYVAFSSFNSTLISVQVSYQGNWRYSTIGKCSLVWLVALFVIPMCIEQIWRSLTVSCYYCTLSL